MQQTPSKVVTNRFQVSFGVWNVLALLLPQAELLRLQALNKYAYDVNISRVQNKYLLPFRRLLALFDP